MEGGREEVFNTTADTYRPIGIYDEVETRPEFTLPVKVR
jgi:hypothetical protein